LKLSQVLRVFTCFLTICLAGRAQTGPNPHAADGQSAKSEPSNSPDDTAALASYLEKFVKVFSTVQTESADPEPAGKLIYEGAIPSMLRELDPHTQFFAPSQFDQLRQMESSEQKGFGSIVSVLPGQVIFLQTLPGTPSNKAGIQAGDELVAINNVAIRSLQP
jgi:carboxyl-terminal processing protease